MRRRYRISGRAKIDAGRPHFPRDRRRDAVGSVGTAIQIWMHGLGRYSVVVGGFDWIRCRNGETSGRKSLRDRISLSFFRCTYHAPNAIFRITNIIAYYKEIEKERDRILHRNDIRPYHYSDCCRVGEAAPK